jgi:hypothetical protein
MRRSSRLGPESSVAPCASWSLAAVCHALGEGRRGAPYLYALASRAIQVPEILPSVGNQKPEPLEPTSGGRESGFPEVRNPKADSDGREPNSEPTETGELVVTTDLTVLLASLEARAC